MVALEAAGVSIGKSAPDLAVKGGSMAVGPIERACHSDCRPNGGVKQSRESEK